MCGYLEILNRIKRELPNHSSEGRVKLGQVMQKQAADRFDFDMAGSTAKFLAGAWLESMERKSLKAKQAHSTLIAFSNYAREQVGSLDDADR